MANFDLQVLLSLVDRLTGPLKAPMAALERLERQTQRVEAGVAQMADGAGLVGAGTVMAAPLALATQEAIDFESAFADVKKVVNFPTPKSLGEMKEDLIDLSDRIPIAATGFAAIAAAAGQAGIAREEIVRFSEDAAKMGVAFDMAAGDAGGAMTGLRTIFKLTQQDVVLLGDSVNYLSNNMDAKAANIVDILNRTGGTGKLIGLTGQQIAALGATFLALKKPPEVAATGINALLLKLATAEQQAKPFQRGLESIGLTARQVKRWMGEDAQGGLLKFLGAVRGSKDVMGTLSDLFGAEYSDDIAALVGNLDTYNKALGLSGDAAKYAGSMNAEYAARADTTANAIQLLKNNTQNLAITVGDIAAPKVRQVAEALGRATRFIRAYSQAHPEAARNVVMLVSGVAGLLVVLGVLTTTLGLVNVAVGQAIGGWGLLKAQWASAQATATALSARIAALGGITAATQTVLRGAAAATWAWTAALLANPITWVVAAVIALGAAAVYAWRNIAQFRDNVRAAFIPVLEAWAQLRASFSSLGAALGPVGAAISGVFARLNGPLNALAYAVGWVLGFILTGLALLVSVGLRRIIDFFSGAVDTVTGAINWIVGLFTGDTDKMRLGVTQIMAGLSRMWEATFSGLVRVVAAFVIRFGPTIMQGVTTVYNWLVTQLGRFRQWGIDLVAGIIAGVILRITGILQAVQGGVNAARDWIATTVSSWRQAGVNIIDGLVGGVQSRIAGAVSAIQALAGRVRGAFTGDLDIRSPSRVFMAYGGHIVQGLSNGITSTAGQAISATRGLALGVAAAGSVSLGAAISPVTSGGLGGGGSPLAPAQASAVSGGGTTIVIQRLEVRSDNPNDFLAGLQQLVSQHQ